MPKHAQVPECAARQTDIEQRAREALQAQYGRALSDDEWQQYRDRLVRLARLLRSWKKTARVRT